MTANPYPLSPAKVNGTLLTVDHALRNPQIITNRVATLTAESLLVDKFFSTGGLVTGGSVLYTKATAADRFTTRDVESRAPATEYPIVQGEAKELFRADVEDFGGKIWVSDEARLRNITTDLDNGVTQLANTVIRKVNSRALEAIDAALDGAGTFVGNNWSTGIAGGVNPTPNLDLPAADWSAAQLQADNDELGIVFDLLLVNPTQRHGLSVTYGENLQKVLASAGLTIFSSPRIPNGTAYLTQRGAAGVVGYEKGLTTEVWDDRNTKRTWVQTYSIPVFTVNQPLAIRKITGLNEPA